MDLELYFDFIVHMAICDGSIDDNEYDYILSVAETFGLKGKKLIHLMELMDALNDGGEDCIGSDINAVLTKIKDKNEPEFIMALVCDSYMLASANGDIHEKERDLLVKLLKTQGNYKESCENEIFEWVLESKAIQNKGLNLFSSICGG